MSRLIESIKVLNGEFYHLDLHQFRMFESLWNIYGKESRIDLKDYLQKIRVPKHGLYKCRVIYNMDILSVDFIPYIKKNPSKVKVVECTDLNYELKLQNRSAFNELFEQYPDFDDFIITKNGFFTDSTYANLLCWDGRDWYTPVKPLLKGIQRSVLLKSKMIKERQIHIEDLHNYSKIGLINALLNFNDKIELSMEQLSI